MQTDLKFYGCLLLNRNIQGAENLKTTIHDIETYVLGMDKLYIFNYTKETQIALLELLQKYKNIEYTNLKTQGQVANYKNALDFLIEKGADYATIIESGYYYEDDCYRQIKKQIIMDEFDTKTAVITPFPIYTCEEHKTLDEEKREIKGSHLLGAFINTHIYKQTEGFYLPYYQTTFDYDYCLEVRKMGYKIVLMNNLNLRNRNFKLLQKNILWHEYTGYQREIYDVYYETRNRLHLWQKYKDFDPEYVKIDKKQQALEIKEMRLFEKRFKDKKQIITQARIDYQMGKMGKAFDEIKF